MTEYKQITANVEKVAPCCAVDIIKANGRQKQRQFPSNVFPKNYFP